MGAAGLTCSAVEMGAKGDLGIELDLDHVPVREENMSAYEMMLSESQERMLMVLEPQEKAEAKAIFVKWGLDFAIVGKTTDDLRFRILHQGDEVANLPIKELGDEAPNMTANGVRSAVCRRSISPMSRNPRITARRCSTCSARPTMPPGAGSGSSTTR
jgi:phosphoribosylformylglycinamidine (FGAM) synthase-like enzyme